MQKPMTTECYTLIIFPDTLVSILGVQSDNSTILMHNYYRNRAYGLVGCVRVCVLWYKVSMNLFLSGTCLVF